MLIHNPALEDEVCALNSIYGDGTISVTFSDLDHTTVSLRPFNLPYAFLLHVSEAYPAVPPKIVGVDNLVLSTQAEVQQNTTYLQACIIAAHRSKDVCLFDAIEEFEPIMRIQARYHQEISGAEVENSELLDRLAMLRDLMKKSMLQVCNLHVGNDLLLGVVECAVCLELFFKVDTANLQCKHSFCRDCLHEGLKSMFRERSELKCCAKSIPLNVVRTFGGLEEDFFTVYTAWLKEIHTEKPMYCPYGDCGAFIPQACVHGEYAKCPFCKKRLCLGCKRKEHAGLCKLDKVLAAMVKRQHWKFCPQCGHLVERTYGCNHMSCVCGTRFCYRCGKEAGCSCGLFEA